MVDMIEKRISCRKYAARPLENEMLDKIRAFQMTPLDPDIKVRWHIANKDCFRSPLKFITENVIAIYSEKKDGYLENAGFMFQQMDLYLQSLGLGVCWVGMGKPLAEASALEPDLDFVILLTVGYPDGDVFRKGTEDFNREPMERITDRPDPRLEPARLAPSSCNSQPWYFRHDGDVIHVFWDQKSLLQRKILAYFNPIDMGIALAHLYVTNPDSFRFFRQEGVVPAKGHVYIGSITL